MISTRRHTILAASSLALLAIVVVAYAYLYHESDATAASVAHERAMIQSQESGSTQSQRLVALYRTTAPSREKLQALFVPADQAVSFIEALEAIGQASGSSVTLSSVSVDPVDQTIPGSTGLMKAHVDAQGSWSSIMDVLTLAEALPYASTVGRVHVGTSVIGASTSRQVWQLSFDIQTLVVATTSTPVMSSQ